MGINTEAHNWTVCSKEETLEYSVPNGMSSLKPSSQGSAIYAKEGSRKIVRARRITPRKQWFSDTTVLMRI